MANRHLARSIVLQTLFEIDFMQIKHKNAESVLLRNIDEFAPGVTDISFMQDLLSSVLKKQDELDSIIEKAAPDWPIAKISPVDRNILRMGLYELIFADKSEVPAKVAINEAIELAKTFGGETSGRFVNGVLGAVYKEIGEPGKDDKSPKRKREVSFEEMAIEKKVGAVVYSYNEVGELTFAFVHDVFGHWTLSKGGLNDGESDSDGVKRIVAEEMGLHIDKVEDELGNTEYIANHPEKGKHRKQVTYYLALANYGELKLGESGGLDDVSWFGGAEILDLNFYNDIVPLITKAVSIVNKHHENR